MNAPGVAGDAPDILKKILRRKAEEVTERCARRSLRELRAAVGHLPPPRGFTAALQRCIHDGRAAVIAEIKRASPSRGLLREQFDPAAIAARYEAAGACCLSVLTDSDFFQGSETHLQQARAACSLPVLRKDFCIDPYQVYETRAAAADCLLLIVAALGDPLLQELADLAAGLDLDVLVEVHDRQELERALAIGARLIGINNRDLRTFETRLSTTVDLLGTLPPEVTPVTESGILQPADVALLRSHGVQAFLVGEAFMRAPDPGAALQALFS